MGKLLRPGLATWKDVAALDANVLLIVNSPAGDAQSVSMVFDELEGRVPAARLHIIAPPGRQAWLSDRGWSDARVLFSVDDAGLELELNYFLESPVAIRWIVAKRFAAVVGTAPHNLYNEEVKEIFERRVGVFLGAGRFLAHTLPEPYLFSLDAACLLQRFNRRRKMDAYDTVCRALVADLHQIWCERGRPSVCDQGPFGEVTGALERHLGAAALAWDETSPLSLPRPETGEAAAEFLSYLEAVLHRAADVQQLQVVNLNTIVADQRHRLGRLQAEVDHRDHLLNELSERANELQRATGTQQDEINRRDSMLFELSARAMELERTISRQQDEINRRDALLEEQRASVVALTRTIGQQQDEINRRDGMLEEMTGRILELQRAVELQQDETNRRDGRLTELQAELAREVQIRDRRLAELHEEQAREVEIRDRRLAELYEEQAREVEIRDRRLVELYEERKEAVRTRDALISELEAECGRLSSGWRGWIVKRR